MLTPRRNPRPWAVLLVVSLAWDVGMGVLFVGALGRLPADPLSWLYILPLWLIGLLNTLGALGMLFTLHYLVITRGLVVRLEEVPLLGRASAQCYRDLEAVELWRGVWTSGRGETAELRLRYGGRERPVELHRCETNVSFWSELFWGWDGFIRGELRQVKMGAPGASWARVARACRRTCEPPAGREVAVYPARLRELADEIAERAGVPVIALEERIPAPSDD